MWMKLDDAFFDHPKFFAAGRHLGKRGRQRAICVWLAGLGWTNRHYTDGFIPDGAIESFAIDERPREVAVVLGFDDVRLWHRDESRWGYRMHDYHDHNPKADQVKDKLKRDRERKRREQGQTDSARNPNGIQTDSPALARARLPALSQPRSEDHGRASRAGCAEPVENIRVLKALIWREVHAVYRDRTDAWSLSDLTERVKCVAAKAHLIYAVDTFHEQIARAMHRVEQQGKWRSA